MWVKFSYALLHDKLLINRDKTGRDFLSKNHNARTFYSDAEFPSPNVSTVLMSEIRLSRSRMLCMGGRVNRISRISPNVGKFVASVQKFTNVKMLRT